MKIEEFKKHEYRKANEYWQKRLLNAEYISDTATAYSFKPFACVEFRKDSLMTPKRIKWLLRKASVNKLNAWENAFIREH